MKKQTILKEEAQRQLEERLDREAKALRANLLRRKQQKRQRPVSPETNSDHTQEMQS